MAYIKSYSNYVLKRKHQDINSGSIYERDITTIGGLNQFAKGQVPIYKSSNFIITVNNESKTSRNHLNKGWEKNGSEDVWTLSNINDTNDVESAEKTLKIVLKQDYYRLRDFAYFGSCVELIRASIIDIINRFPGELHVPRIEVGKDANKNPIYEGIPVFYTSKDILKDENGNPERDENGNIKKEGDNGIVRLGDDYDGGNWVFVDNPHNINIHTFNINEDDVENKLKYLCLSRDKYNNVTSHTVTEYACVTEYNVETKNGKLIRKSFKSKGFKQLTDAIIKALVTYEISKLGVGAKVADVTINGISIGAFVGNNGEIVYLTKSNLGQSILQPKEEVKNEFFDSLDNFQKILMNRDSNPKYTALFEVISENSFGYVTELKSFTFPTTFGGNNLATDNAAYNVYINSLQKYAEFYDEYFCDNIWRSMTHESIKNFDWTYTREYGVGEEEEYVFGGTRMQKTLRLIGREFDEIKTYIDALKNYQKVDYGKGNAIPDYFLTDVVNQEGWDVENIYPYDTTFKQVQKIDTVEIKPYSINNVPITQQYGYFYKCEGCEGRNDTFKPSFISGTSADTNQEIYDECLGVIRPKIKQYISDKKYTFSDVNNHFMKMLKLNSKNIFRKKGTIQGIETLLSLFGLKSKRWYNEYYGDVTKQCKKCGKKLEKTVTKCPICEGEIFVNMSPDYEIKEYVTMVNAAITDAWLLDNRNMNEIDWYNSTKTVGYDTDDFRNGVYYSYQGLPVRVYVDYDNNNEVYKQNDSGNTANTRCNIDRLPVDANGNTISVSGGTRYLYPYFSPYKIIDGNPYYQMYGGWLNRKPRVLTKDNEIVNATTNNVTIPLHTETNRNIRDVETIKDLINLPKTSLKNNDLCYVNSLKGNYALIDGEICDIFTDNNGSYIKTNIINNSAKVGSKIFASELTVTDPTVSGNLMKYVFSEYKEGSEIRIYIIDNGTLQAFGKYYAINNVTFFKDGGIVNLYSDTPSTNLTPYFKLHNVNNKTEINTTYGWVQLHNDEQEYKRINTVVDKFKGNNPHTGHMSYDGGKEYISYFVTLFKHALEGNQFNERCYGDSFFNDLITIRTKGWKELDSGGNYCYPEYDDRKIHYYGGVINSGGTKTTSGLTDSYGTGSTIGSKLDSYNISDQIINIKRVDINFYGEKDNPTIKFFDNVVMNYLEQVLPSTLIINVNYSQTI